jgi:hypothetical protein
VEEFKKNWFLILVILIGAICFYPKVNFNRYELQNVDGMILLLDKQKGLVWRNIKCDDGVPNCWQSMDFQSYVFSPVGYSEYYGK